jgi:hypothetical protein
MKKYHHKENFQNKIIAWFVRQIIYELNFHSLNQFNFSMKIHHSSFSGSPNTEPPSKETQQYWNKSVKKEQVKLKKSIITVTYEWSVFHGAVLLE